MPVVTKAPRPSLRSKLSPLQQQEIAEIETEEYKARIASGQISGDPLDDVQEETKAVKLRRLHRKKPEGVPKGVPMLVEQIGRKKDDSFEMMDEDKDLVRSQFVEGIFGKKPVLYVDSNDPLTDMPTIAFRMLVNSHGVHTVRSVANFLGVPKATFEGWMRNTPRLSLAIELGQGIQEYCLASRMAKGITYPTSLIFMMKNVHGWTERMETSQRISIAAVIANAEEKAVYVDWEKPDTSLLASRVSSGTPAHTPSSTPISSPTITPSGQPEGQPSPATEWETDSIPAGVPVAGENIDRSSVANK